MREMVSPGVYESGGWVRHSELVGAVSREIHISILLSCPEGWRKDGSWPCPSRRPFPGGELRGEPPKIPSQEMGKLQSHTKQPDP